VGEVLQMLDVPEQTLHLVSEAKLHGNFVHFIFLITVKSATIQKNEKALL